MPIIETVRLYRPPAGYTVLLYQDTFVPLVAYIYLGFVQLPSYKQGAFWQNETQHY